MSGDGKRSLSPDARSPEPRRRRVEPSHSPSPEPREPRAPPPAPKPAKHDMHDVDEWEKERKRLAQWEKTGEVPQAKPKLAHLSTFLGKQAPAKEAVSAAEAAAAEAAREAARRKAELEKYRQEQEKMLLEKQAKMKEEKAQAEKQRVLEAEREKAAPKFKVPKPVFDDHDALEYVCDICKQKRWRSEYTPDQLKKMGDCDYYRKDDTGPWRGMLVRLHERGFGFVDCPQLYRENARDVFLHARFVEALMGGHRGVKAALAEQGRQYALGWGKSRHSFARVEFNVEFTPEGKVVAKNVIKLDLVCKHCEASKATKEQTRMMGTADTIEPGPKGPRPGKALPAKPGFDPRAKLDNILGGLRGKLGLPQPGAANCLPAPKIYTRLH